MRCVFSRGGPFSYRNLALVAVKQERYLSAYRGQSEDHKLYEGHIPITLLQKAILTAGSSILSLVDPARGDMVAVNGEVTGFNALEVMYKKMTLDPEGQQILKERPRINSATVDLDSLVTYPEHSLGKEYVNFLKANKVTPDTRLPVRFIDDPDLAYVMQRYREIHDIVHTLLAMPTNMLGEVSVKWVEGLQTGLPMCVAGGIFGAVRLKRKNRATYLNEYLPWAIHVGSKSSLLMNVYFERRWEQNVDELRQNLGIPRPPSLKAAKPW